MRTLDYNKRKFYYCLHVGREKIYDEDHNFTGDYTPEYLPAQEARGNISAATGTADVEQFGIGIEYDKTIVLQGLDWDITEDTVLFVDAEPTYEDEEQTIPLYNYIVTRVAKSLNHTTLAIKRVQTK